MWCIDIHNDLDEAPYQVVCATCGSDDVLRDAYARWNPEKQDFDLVATFDHTFCGECDGECSVKAIPYEKE